MKNVKLIITLITLITLLATASMAVTGQELADSPLTPEQKNQVIAKVIKKDGAGAQVLFDKLMEEVAMAEAIVFRQQFQTEMKAKADAKLLTAQNKAAKELNEELIPQPMNKTWATATAYKDTTVTRYPGTSKEYEQFIAKFMTKRYSLKGEFDTIDSVETAYNQRSAELKTEVAREAKTRAIVINALLPLTTKMGEMKIRIDILEQNDKNMKADLASVTREQKNNGHNFNALKVLILDDDKDNEERFNEILEQEKEK